MMSLLDSVADPQPESNLQFQTQKAKSRLTELKHFHLYPKPAVCFSIPLPSTYDPLLLPLLITFILKQQQWVIDAKTPIGFYDDRGYWSPMEVTERILRHSRQKMRVNFSFFLSFLFFFFVFPIAFL